MLEEVAFQLHKYTEKTSYGSLKECLGRLSVILLSVLRHEVYINDL